MSIGIKISLSIVKNQKVRLTLISPRTNSCFSLSVHRTSATVILCKVKEQKEIVYDQFAFYFTSLVSS